MCRKLPFVARGSCAMASSCPEIRRYADEFLKATAPDVTGDRRSANIRLAMVAHRCHRRVVHRRSPSRGGAPTGGEVAAWLLAPRMIKDWQAYWFRA